LKGMPNRHDNHLINVFFFNELTQVLFSYGKAPGLQAVSTTLKRSAHYARALHTGCSVHTGISSPAETRRGGPTILVADDQVVANLNVEQNGS
jgi:hypothetical protein